MAQRGTKTVGVAAALVLGVVLTASAEEKPRRIEYRGDRLSVHVEQMPVGEVLDEIGRQSGAEIVGSPREDRQVSAQFESLPVADGLARLLGSENFILRYGKGDQLRMIHLLGGQPTRSVPTALIPGNMSPTTTMPQVTAVPPQNLFSLFQQHAPVPVTGRLAQTLGSPTATFPQLFDAALHQPDAGIRSDALRTWLNGVETDAELRSALVSSLNSMDEAQLSNFVRNAAGEHAEELATQVATQARGSEIRSKAAGLLQMLRANGNAGG
jgi:hypothetical protein